MIQRSTPSRRISVGSKPLFGVPHYHVLLRYGYEVRTCDSPKDVRRVIDTLYAQGIRSVVLTCQQDECRIYIPDADGRLSEEAIHERIDSERHVA